MSFITIGLLAIALAMDCFAVSVSMGIVLRRFEWRPIMTASFLFGLFQGLMPIIGWLLCINLESYIKDFDHWIAFILLSFIGGKMLVEAFSGSEEQKVLNPHSLRTLFMLAIATSIDALAVGVSFSVLGGNIYLSSAIIAVVAFAFSVVGAIIGIKMGNFCGAKSEIIGGLILVGIGVKILVEHLSV